MVSPKLQGVMKNHGWCTGTKVGLPAPSDAYKWRPYELTADSSGRQQILF